MAVSVYRIEYEILPSMNQWTAFVGAFSHEEAVQHINKTVGKPIRVTASGLYCRLDDISAPVRKNVVDAHIGKKREESSIEEVKIESERKVKK